MGYWIYWKNNTKKLLINISWFFFMILICAVLPLLGIVGLALFTDHILIPKFGQFIGGIIFLIIFFIPVSIFVFFLSYFEYKNKLNKGGKIEGKK